jgi:hypothetical protein
MATIEHKPKLELEVRLILNEGEVRALDALVGYGDDAFMSAFKEKLGKYYIENHEQDLRRLFKSLRAEIPPILERLKAAKEAFK